MMLIFYLHYTICNKIASLVKVKMINKKDTSILRNQYFMITGIIETIIQE